MSNGDVYLRAEAKRRTRRRFVEPDEQPEQDEQPQNVGLVSQGARSEVTPLPRLSLDEAIRRRLGGRRLGGWRRL